MTKTTVLGVEGMTCGHCVKHVTAALTRVAGVSAATVQLEPGEASVTHEEAVTAEALVRAVEDEGYAASPKAGSGA
ncbi:MAG: heavy-metal-associated domain-containing protein [Polyangiaceae bacterium]|jgi:copper chaperone|nr:heavy-metal-associated domain-containing protein [Polyangiaceae bacterium]